MKAAGYKTRTRKAMKAIGVYKEEFEPTITIYAQLQEERDTLQAEYKEGGYQFDVATASGKKKAPIVTTLESLRKDILNYADALGLTPRGALKLQAELFKPEEETSYLEKAMEELKIVG